jgi:hypothetical protein
VSGKSGCLARQAFFDNLGFPVGVGLNHGIGGRERCQDSMALPPGAQGFTAMADALATAQIPLVGWCWRTALVSNMRPG